MEQHMEQHMEQSNYKNLSCKELIEICKKNNIKGYSKLKKNGIINLLMKGEEQESKNESKNESNTQPKLRLVDLFAGTGAFTLAFEQTGKVECVFANDINESSKKIYDLNFNHKLTLKDINEVEPKDIPSHDILTGGFPCQPFSIAGKQMGFEDDRSNVFWKIMKIAQYHNPKIILLENVKNLLSHDQGRSFQTIKKSINENGYKIHFSILDTSKISGIPQHRERIYIVCIREDIDEKIKFIFEFSKVDKLPISNFITDDKIVKDKYYYTEKSAIYPLLKDRVKSKESIYQYRRVYVRQNKKGECPTLTANMGTGGHNVPIILTAKGIRKLTPRECFNFQGFAETYKLPDLSDSNLYKLAGNAVSVPVVKLIANSLINKIDLGVLF